MEILRECSDATLTKTGSINSVTYFVGSGASSAISSSYSISKAGCTPDFLLYFWNDSIKDWDLYNAATNGLSTYAFVSSFNGQLILNTSNFATYRSPVIYLAKIVAKNTITTLESQFNITIKDKCYDLAVTSGIILKDTSGNIPTQASPFIWDLW